MTRQISASGYSAVRDGGAGVLDLSSRGRILVTGSEAVMFLNGLVTNDMKTLERNSWMPAAFPNVQGRLLASVRILNHEQGFLIDTEPATRQKVLQLLDRFTLAGDFRVSDLSDESAVLSVQGHKAPTVIQSIFGEVGAGIKDREVTNTMWGGHQVTIIRATHTAEDGLDLFLDAADRNDLQEALIAAGVAPVNEESAEVLRIEAGIPRYGIDMDESTVVTEANLDEAVSFTKGCYVGQEIIVRIKHRGHVAKKLAGIVLEREATIEAGAKILSIDDKEVGRVTSSTFSPKLDKTIGLGYVKYDYLAAGTGVRVSAGDTNIPAKVSDLPLVQGSWHQQVDGLPLLDSP
jgi:folate-binding protein YgfZ